MNNHYFDGQDELLILVDNQDNEIGVKDKLSVHREGLLHRAFSIFIFNARNELLLQQRAKIKYHSPNLWTNTCCGHPRPGESNIEASSRRLFEEMGIKSNLNFSFEFLYKFEFSNGLTEHEIDHVFIGKTDDIPEINKKEVQAWKYITIEDLEKDLSQNPDRYTPWLKICFPKLKQNIPSI